MKTRTIGHALAGLAGISLLAACGSDPKATSPTTTVEGSAPTAAATARPPGAAAATASSKGACSILTRDVVAAALGREPEPGKEQPVEAGRFGICNYDAITVTGTTAEVFGATLRYGPGRASTMDAEAKGIAQATKGPTVEVPGVGDKALFSSSSTTIPGGKSTTSSWISVVKGTVLIQINVVGPSGEAASKQAAVAMATAALGNL